MPKFRKKGYKGIILILRKVEEDVVAFGDGEFLTDLSLTLVNSLKTLASEHVYLLCRKISLKTKT